MRVTRKVIDDAAVTDLWAAADAPYEIELRRIVDASDELTIPHRSEVYTVKVWNPRIRRHELDPGCRFLCPYFVADQLQMAQAAFQDVVYQLRRMHPSEEPEIVATALHGLAGGYVDGRRERKELVRQGADVLYDTMKVRTSKGRMDIFLWVRVDGYALQHRNTYTQRLIPFIKNRRRR